MDAIILCGGLATRLKEITEDKIPKCLVEVKGIPFIKYQLDQLKRSFGGADMYGYKLDRVILAVGRLHEQVIEYVQTIQHEYDFEIFYSIEPTQLGTGGAMKYAWRFVSSSNVLIMNGDVVNDIDMVELVFSFSQHSDAFLMSLVEVKDTDRFGIVRLTGDGAICGWVPKQYVYSALANRGVYVYNGFSNPFEHYPKIFSFENDFVANHVHDMDGVMYGMLQDGYFIDIGIPKDYMRYCEYVNKN